MRAILTACLLTVAAAVGASAWAADFVEGPCPFELPAGEIEGASVRCGRLLVPLDRTRPDGPVASLQVAVLASRSERPGVPIVYLEGGPGAPAVAYVPTWWTESALRGRADLIVFDQRGSGFSTPSLDCYEWYLPDVSAPEPACRARLERAGIDLAWFGSDDSAADVIDLLDALEIERADLFGVSYGTRLALTILRRSPERVRAAVLDGVYPPEAEHLERQAVLGYEALSAVFAACRADAACNAAYPRLDRALTAAMRQLDARPMRVPNGRSLSGRDVYRSLVDALYDGSTAAYLPALVYAAWREDGRRWERLLDDALGPWMSDEEARAEIERLIAWLARLESPDDVVRDLDDLDADAYALLRARAEGLFDDDAEAMYYAVECAEEVAFTDLWDARRRIAELPAPFGFLESDVVSVLDTCAAWSIDVGPSGTREPVASDVPTLLLSGGFDPITPPVLASEAAAYLERSHAFVFPGRGHAVLEVDPCATEIALAFLERPDRPPDASCLESLPDVAFELP